MGMSTDFGRRLKLARKHAGLTQKQLAPLAGMSQSNLSELETVAHESGKTVQLAAVCGVNAHWLATGEGEMLAASAPVPISLKDNPDYPAIRRVRFKLSAGASGFAVEPLDDDDAPIVFRRQWFASRGLDPAQLLAVRVANGSMEPGLYHGDTVVVNTADSAPRDGEVFAVNYEGELVIKRLQRDAGEWWLSSDNPDRSRYPRKLCGEGVCILGRIVHKQSERI